MNLIEAIKQQGQETRAMIKELGDSAVEIMEGLTHEVAVRDRALEIMDSDPCMWPERAIVQAREELSDATD